MKKLNILFAMVIGLFLVGTVTVNALTEADIKDKLFQTITVGGEEFKLSSGERKIVEDYLDQNEISDAHAAIICEKIDAAINIIKGQGNVNFKNYPQNIKNDLKALVDDISNSTSVKASLTKEGLIVKNSDGSTVVITSLVKQTGYETNKTALIIGLSFIIVAVGTGLVIKQVKTSE